MLVSVLTATIPGREEYLREACASVKAQTLKSREHLVGLDQMHEGQSRMLNAIYADAKGDYLLVLNDDDILLPRCLEILVGVALEEDADVVYSIPCAWKENQGVFDAYHPPSIPMTALIRRSAWVPFDEKRKREEDRGIWEEMVAVGRKFVRYEDEPTWIYRFHTLPDGLSGNKSRHPATAWT